MEKKFKKYALVTGSSGLIGSESVSFLIKNGFIVIGIDNDMRSYFFGQDASTKITNSYLIETFKSDYIFHNFDIRDECEVEALFKKYEFELIIHAAAQPSHDWAAKEPLTDFSINATGTLILLENYRKFSPKATFIYTSTNKVYGDRPNMLPLIELEDRYELPVNHEYAQGISESMSIDNTKHSIFGVSKLSADIMVQEYGKYFNLHTGVFRGGCLTGPAHRGTQLHGFLAYLVKCIATGTKYTILGYKGKQVRDNIHAFDLVNMFWNYHKNPRYGEVYNAGGGRQSNISIIEAIKKIENVLGKNAVYEYKETNRIGDHIWYISDLSKFKSHFPDWKFTYNIDEILKEMCELYK